MASVAWASRPVHRPKSTPRSRRARIAATVRGDTVCRLVSSVPSISQSTALMWLKVTSMGGLSGLCGGAECGRKWCTWYTKAQARPANAKTTTKVPGPFVVAEPEGCPGRNANHHNIRRFSAKSRFSSNVVMVFTALRHDPNAGVQTTAAPREPPSRPRPHQRASAARQTSPPARGQSPVGPRRRTCCQSP